VCSLFADPNIADLLEGEHREILAEMGMEYTEKVVFGAQKL